MVVSPSFELGALLVRIQPAVPSNKIYRSLSNGRTPSSEDGDRGSIPFSGTMKKCTKCGVSKPPSSFVKNKSKKNGLASHCLECHRVLCIDYYGRNSTKFAERNVKRRISAKRFVWEFLKTHPCIDCGEADVVVLDFDHRSPDTKKKAVSLMVQEGNSLDLIKKEMNKCDIRCANCHRRRTAKQFQWDKKGGMETA